jgi:glycosyltransferase involved in cell wall biosynthesis
MDKNSKNNFMPAAPGQTVKKTVNIGIYDRYLSTGGGGERYSCKMAEILSKEPGYKVYLITDLYADLNTVQDRLNLDLSKVTLKLFPFLSEEYAAKITGEYDIFINATYLSSLKGHASANIYLCYFPTAFDVDFSGIHRFLLLFFRLPAVWLYRLADKISGGYKEIEVLEGIYDIKRFMLRRGVWSCGRFTVKYKNAAGSIRIGLKNPEITGIKSMRCQVKLYTDAGNQDPVYSKELFLFPGAKHIEEIKPQSLKVKSSTYLLSVESDTFISQSQQNGASDTRKLGVVAYNEQKTPGLKKLILKLLGFVPLFLVTYPRDLSFLKTYDRIISISAYSRNWMEKLWKTESEILYPPVDTEMFYCAKKQKIIISVGRFFPQHHNKKQLELAQNFISLYESNRDIMSGYRLVLAGGVENISDHLEYVRKIKELGKGYPIEVLTNISWEKLRETFSEALIFWHASGMGEDQQKHPEKFEHFGITTVEAMASGAIPVVVGKGGQPEIIEDGVNGFLFESWDRMKEITLEICRDFNLGGNAYNSISNQAGADAQRFSAASFSRRLLEIIKSHI